MFVSYKIIFLEKEGAQQCVAMRISARVFEVTVQCIAFLCIAIAIAIENFSFYGALFKRILAWEGGTSKTWFLD